MRSTAALATAGLSALFSGTSIADNAFVDRVAPPEVVDRWSPAVAAPSNHQAFVRVISSVDSPATSRTLLGRNLRAIREHIVASGEPLLSWDEVRAEVEGRRSGKA
jgi:hypothetical protein